MVVISTIHNNSRKIALRVRADLGDWCVEDNDRNGSSHTSSDPIAHLSARLDPVGPFFYNNERTNATATSRSGGTETDTTAEMEKNNRDRGNGEKRRRSETARQRSEKTTRDQREESKSWESWEARGWRTGGEGPGGEWVSRPLTRWGATGTLRQLCHAGIAQA